MSPIDNRLLVPRQEPLLLDYAPGAAAAYSLRKLSLSYTGPVVTVRRASDDAEADFTASEIDDGTLLGWVGAGVSGFVKTWHDQSGEGNDATQTTAGYQPQLVDAGSLITEGGKAAVRFDGVNDLLGIAGEIPLGGDFTIFGLFTRPTSAIQVVFRKGNSTLSTRFGSINASGAIEILAISATGSALASTMTAGKLCVATASRVGSLSLHVNGAIGGTASMSSVNSTNSPLGEQGLGGQASGAFYYNGKMQEIIIYPSDMTAQRQRIEGDMAWYY